LDFLPRAVGGDFPAKLAGSGAEVDDEVAAAHGVLIVLDDEEAVSFVAEGDQGIEELDVVAGVEADGGFVEDVEDTAEVGPQLGGEADALAFAAAEGGGGAVELEVAEPDFA
jgi:hypothetical protein